MESKAFLADADRAAAAPFLDYPTLGLWYPFASGGMFALTAAGAELTARREPWGLALLVVACLLVGMLAAWYRRRWGTWPNTAQAPVEVRDAYHRLLALFLVTAALSILACWLGGLWGVAFTFLAFCLLTGWYEFRCYPAACDRVRSRLA